MTEAGQSATSSADLEAWVRQELVLGPDVPVAISEKPGTDPRCSPVVTEVAVGDPDGDSYSFHIERPLSEVQPMDVVAALAFGGH